MVDPVEYDSGRSDVGNHHVARLDLFRHVHLVEINRVAYQIAITVGILHGGLQIESDADGLVVVGRQVEVDFRGIAWNVVVGMTRRSVIVPQSQGRPRSTIIVSDQNGETVVIQARSGILLVKQCHVEVE